MSTLKSIFPYTGMWQPFRYRCQSIILMLLALAGIPISLRAQETSRQRFNALIASGWQAHGKDWLQLERCFLEAEALHVRLLNEEEVRAISFGRRSRGDLKGSVKAASYNYRTYRCRNSLDEYISALIAIHDYKSSRDVFADWDKRPVGVTKLGDNSNSLREEVAIKFSAVHITLDENRFPRDIKEWHRQVGYWEYPFPDGDKWHEARFLVKNVARHEERIDNAGNRWVRLFPENTDNPVELTIFWKARPDFIDLNSLPDIPYSVPDKNRKYLGKSEDCDPTTPLCKATAAQMHVRTTAEKVRAVWEWQNRVKYTKVEKREGEPESDAVMRTMKGVCITQTFGAVALSRALGLAARHVRGSGHSWVETWIPGIGWFPTQQYVDLGRTDWGILRFLAEPVDVTTHSRLLDWKTSSGQLRADSAYTAQFLDFYLWGLNQHGEHFEKVLYSMEDLSIDMVAQRLVPTSGRILQTEKW